MSMLHFARFDTLFVRGYFLFGKKSLRLLCSSERQDLELRFGRRLIILTNDFSNE